MRICVPKETKEGEKRVALVPDIISKLTRAGLDVTIESGAGISAEHSDAAYEAAGAAAGLRVQASSGSLNLILTR